MQEVSDRNESHVKNNSEAFDVHFSLPNEKKLRDLIPTNYDVLGLNMGKIVLFHNFHSV